MVWRAAVGTVRSKVWVGLVVCPLSMSDEVNDRPLGRAAARKQGGQEDAHRARRPRVDRHEQATLVGEVAKCCTLPSALQL